MSEVTRLIEHPEISRIEVYPSVAPLARAAAHAIIEVVKQNPNAVITYATGDTMIPIYQAVASIINQDTTFFRETRAFHLDENFPADPNVNEFSFVRYLRQRVFGPLQIPPDNIFEIDGTARDAGEEALRYDRVLSENPVALAILGIGPGGHIGFNERGAKFELRTRYTCLSGETIHRDHVERGLSTPETVITQGPANILEADRILMIAFGSKKGEYLHEALCGSVTPDCPASALRTDGKKVTIIIDETAAEVLERK